MQDPSWDAHLRSDPASFDYELILFDKKEHTGETAVVTEKTVEVILPGEEVPKEAGILLRRESLEKMGRYLIAQGILEPRLSVTEAERLRMADKVIMYQEQQLALMQKQIATLEKLIDQLK